MVDMVQTHLIKNELVDIEPLVAPGVDWSFWLESGLWVLAGLLTLLFLLYFVRFLSRPLLFKWQLVRLQKRVTGNQSTMVKEAVEGLYVWLSDYHAWLSATRSSSMHTDPFKEALTDLQERVNECCFSKQTVSRETYLNLTSEAQSLLKQHKQYSTLQTVFTSPGHLFKSLKRKVLQWKR